MRRSYKKLRSLENSAEVVLRSLGQIGLTDQMRRLRICRQWPLAVGPHIAARTWVQSFSRGTLLVRAASTAWQNELSYLKRSLIKKINGRLDKACVRELRVVCGQLPAAKPAAPVKPRATAAQLNKARQLAEPIGDAATREAFEKLLLTALGRPASFAPPG